jgi:hypothetical protein
MKLLAPLIILLTGCAHEIPASICAEYMGIRRVSKNFVFCNNQIVWDRNQRHYIRRLDENDLGLPDVEVEEPK